MGGQYSHLQFFRRTPSALLARYFQEKHGVLQEIAFDKLKGAYMVPRPGLRAGQEAVFVPLLPQASATNP